MPEVPCAKTLHSLQQQLKQLWRIAAGRQQEAA